MSPATDINSTAHIDDSANDADARDVAVGPDGTVFLANGSEGMFAYTYDELATAIGDHSSHLPNNHSLHQNYPNPFNPITTIRYDMATAGYIELKVYNSWGQEIRTLLNSVQPVGTHRVIWDGRDNRGNYVPSGVYFYKMRAGAFVETRTMLLIR